METTPSVPKPHPMARYKECKTAFEFKADLERAGQVLGIESAREVAVTLGLQLVSKVSVGTPVDRGRARAGWNIAEGKIDTSVPPPVEEGQAIPAKTYSAEGLTGKSVIYITNSLPYIVPLEYGHSQQAPHGMLRIAIAEIMASINLG